MTIVEMAVVMLVISILMGIVLSFINNIAFLRTAQDEATTLLESLIFCRKSAIRSNQTVYMEFDLDGESYRAYRYDRADNELSEDEILSKRHLSSSNSIVSIITAGSTRISQGILKIPFAPDGSSEQLAIHLGPEPEIRKTIVFNRYGGTGEILNGEGYNQLDEAPWEDNLEDW